MDFLCGNNFALQNLVYLCFYYSEESLTAKWSRYLRFSWNFISKNKTLLLRGIVLCAEYAIGNKKDMNPIFMELNLSISFRLNVPKNYPGSLFKNVGSQDLYSNQTIWEKTRNLHILQAPHTMLMRLNPELHAEHTVWRGDPGKPC